MKTYNNNNNNCLSNRRNDSYLFDPFFDDFFGFRPKFDRDFANLMKTDVEETEKNYCVSVELPGFKKEEVSLELKEGYLTVSANHSDEDKENDKKKKYIRRERSYSSCQRTFYLGDNVTEEDIDASFENGVLKICVAKTPEKVPENKKILIK